MNPEQEIIKRRQQFLPLPGGEGRLRGRRSAEGELYSNFGVHGEGWGEVLVTHTFSLRKIRLRRLSKDIVDLRPPLHPSAKFPSLQAKTG